MDSIWRKLFLDSFSIQYLQLVLLSLKSHCLKEGRPGSSGSKSSSDVPEAEEAVDLHPKGPGRTFWKLAATMLSYCENYTHHLKCCFFQHSNHLQRTPWTRYHWQKTMGWNWHVFSHPNLHRIRIGKCKIFIRNSNKTKSLRATPE